MLIDLVIASQSKTDCCKLKQVLHSYLIPLNFYFYGLNIVMIEIKLVILILTIKFNIERMMRYSINDKEFYQPKCFKFEFHQLFFKKEGVNY